MVGCPDVTVMVSVPLGWVLHNPSAYAVGLWCRRPSVNRSLRGATIALYRNMYRGTR